MNKSKAIIIILMIISTAFFAGCAKEKQAEKLSIQASKYLSEGDFENATELYNKALILKEDPTIRQKLAEVKYEQESVQITKKFLESTNNIIYKIDNISNFSELRTLLLSEKALVDEFEKIDTLKVTEIADFIKKIKADVNYIEFKSYYDNKYIKDADINMTANRAIDELLGRADLAIVDSILINSFKTNIKLFLNNLPKDIPNKYN